MEVGARCGWGIARKAKIISKIFRNGRSKRGLPEKIHFILPNIQQSLGAQTRSLELLQRLAFSIMEKLRNGCRSSHPRKLPRRSHHHQERDYSSQFVGRIPDRIRVVEWTELCHRRNQEEDFSPPWSYLKPQRPLSLRTGAEIHSQLIWEKIA